MKSGIPGGTRLPSSAADYYAHITEWRMDHLVGGQKQVNPTVMSAALRS